jgi:Vanadium chloroperoxidase N-terminal domain
MKLRLATILVLAVAIVAATFSASTTLTPPAKAAPGPWNVKGCPPGDPTPAPPCANDNAILLWNEELLATIRANAPGTGPTVAARALGVLHTATYDAWEAYDPTARSTLPNGIAEPQASSNPAADKAKAISFAAYTTLTDLFPYRRQVYANRLVAQTYSVSDSSPAANVGRAAAQAVINYRHGDGSNQTRNDNGTPDNPDDDTVTYPDPACTPVETAQCYKPTRKWNEPTDPWRWKPLCVRTAAGVAAGVPPEPDPSNVNNCTPSSTQTHYTTQRPLTPQWPKIKTFAASPLQYHVTGPPKNPNGTYSNADVATALNDAGNLDDTKKVTAEYWADGPGSEFPPGHMAVFAQALSRKKGHTLDTDVKMFFALGNALLDASVGSWTTKYKYDFWRPITAIRHIYQGQTIPSWRGPVPAAEWTPYQPATVVTPAFPEYVSGHSTFSAAGGIILNAFTTSDIFDAYVTITARNPDGSYWSKIQPGVPTNPVTLSWPTFTAAADQAGISRRYGGIHFWSGDYHARMLGNLLGRGAYSKAQSYIQGRIGS